MLAQSQRDLTAEQVSEVHESCMMGNLHAFLLSADFFFKINVFENFLQEYHQSVKQCGFRSGPTLCRA